VAERGNLAEVVEILAHRLRRWRYRNGRHWAPPRYKANLDSLQHLMLHRNMKDRGRWIVE
jgi:hypothetical protein